MINRLEKKFGKYAIKGLMKYVIILYAVGSFINLINSEFYYQWLMLDIDKLLEGQIWRIVTFLIQPPGDSYIFLFIILYVDYIIGSALENAWGSFRFNMFYITGVLFNILAVVLIYVGIYILSDGELRVSYPISLFYLNTSIFLAFAMTYPEMNFYLLFMIPVKAKYFGILEVVIIAAGIYDDFRKSGWLVGVCTLITAVVAMANFLIYYISMRKNRFSPKNIKRQMEFTRDVKRGAANGNVVDFQGHTVITRHKCAECGRTELDDENLEFRFCSKCDGNYEYCNEHLFSHEHRKKDIQV